MGFNSGFKGLIIHILSHTKPIKFRTRGITQKET